LFVRKAAPTMGTTQRWTKSGV